MPGKLKPCNSRGPISSDAGASVVAGAVVSWANAADGPICVYLHGVGDPGNVGTVIRSAEAFGASCVALGPGCADPHGPKAVRASMGAVFAVELARASPAELPGARIALSADAPDTLEEVAAGLEGEATLLIGAEREGLPQELVSHSSAHSSLHQFRGMDVVEVLPAHDVSEITALAAATVMWEYLALLGRPNADN